MTQVYKLTDLTAYVMYFVGATIDECLSSAQEWAKARGVNPHRYYVQKTPAKSSKSIIIDYTLGD